MLSWFHRIATQTGVESPFGAQIQQTWRGVKLPERCGTQSDLRYTLYSDNKQKILFNSWDDQGPWGIFPSIMNVFEFRNWRKKNPFCDPNMLLLWCSSVDVDKLSLFTNFQSIQMSRLWIMHVLRIHVLYRPPCW